MSIMMNTETTRTEENKMVDMMVVDIQKIVAEKNAGKIPFLQAEEELTFIWDLAIRHGLSSNLAKALREIL